MNGVQGGRRADAPFDDSRARAWHAHAPRPTFFMYLSTWPSSVPFPPMGTPSCQSSMAAILRCISSFSNCPTRFSQVMKKLTSWLFHLPLLLILLFPFSRSRIVCSSCVVAYRSLQLVGQWLSCEYLQVGMAAARTMILEYRILRSILAGVPAAVVAQKGSRSFALTQVQGPQSARHSITSRYMIPDACAGILFYLHIYIYIYSFVVLLVSIVNHCLVLVIASVCNDLRVRKGSYKTLWFSSTTCHLTCMGREW